MSNVLIKVNYNKASTGGVLHSMLQTLLFSQDMRNKEHK